MILRGIRWHVFFFKRKPDIKYKYINELKISFPNGGFQSYSCDTKKGGSRVEPWKDFYKWYFSRKHSPYFMFSFDEGESLILRERIIGIDVKIKKIQEI